MIESFLDFLLPQEVSPVLKETYVICDKTFLIESI